MIQLFTFYHSINIFVNLKLTLSKEVKINDRMPILSRGDNRGK